MNDISNLKRLIIMLMMVSITRSASAQVSQAESEIRDIMKELTAAGISVAVVKNNHIIYTHSFGVSDVESQKPLTDDNIFRIASISKSFSATSIMQLIEAKKCSLDDDFSNLVGFKVRNPKYPDVVITLRMVMSHTSSVNDSQGYFTLDTINPGKNPNFAKCYNTYSPGAGYEYCNLNYNMVGAVIERLSGERFDQYVKHHILDPLGLYGGYCVDSLDHSRFAKLYEYDSVSKQLVYAPLAYNPRSQEVKNYLIGYDTPIFSPTGGMKISATDLAKYMMMHMNYGKLNGVRIISKKSSRTMQTKVSDGEGGYGLALRHSHDLIEHKDMVGHTGSSYGLTSGMFFEPKEKFGIVVICNGSNQAYYPGSDDINMLNRKTINVLYKYFIK
ncbi:serine hydrolase domain-containing protein [Mucilaginibacter sp. CSA2-8R]|uniref:serine hydrolase domain-containing protein n=1 Tax=Mucilaginibacter sp. CSA2-8R TaxID=3141542 RepID=UPI00315DA722